MVTVSRVEASFASYRLSLIRGFALEFQRVGLYDTGFADAFREGGATRAEDCTAMRISLAYVKGCADTARVACRYMSAAWHIAHILGLAVASLDLALQQDYPAVRVERMIDTYRRELAALLPARAVETG